MDEAATIGEDEEVVRFPVGGADLLGGMFSVEHSTTLGTYSADGEVLSNREAHSSAVSWGAVVAGAFVAAALSLTMLALGAGFELLSVSPWSNTGGPMSAVGTATIVWLIVIQIVASGLGGYLAGRLRTKWTAIHSDEVFFRDTAHGFLVWAVAVVITGAFLGSAATAMVGGAVANGEMSAAGHGYFVDALFRSGPSQTASTPADGALRGESAKILTNMLRDGETAAADRAYLAQLVSSRTGLSQNDAEQRVSKLVVQARQAADAVRKATARLLLWTFLALLIGALTASWTATIGGRQRDHVKAV